MFETINMAHWKHQQLSTAKTTDVNGEVVRDGEDTGQIQVKKRSCIAKQYSLNLIPQNKQIEEVY